MVSPAERTAGGEALRSGTLIHSRDSKDNTVVKVEREWKVMKLNTARADSPLSQVLQTLAV